MPTDFEFMKYISEGTKVIEFEFTLSSRMFITVNNCYGEGKIFDMQWMSRLFDNGLNYKLQKTWTLHRTVPNKELNPYTAMN